MGQSHSTNGRPNEDGWTNHAESVPELFIFSLLCFCVGMRWVPCATSLLGAFWLPVVHRHFVLLAQEQTWQRHIPSVSGKEQKNAQQTNANAQLSKSPFDNCCTCTHEQLHQCCHVHMISPSERPHADAFWWQPNRKFPSRQLLRFERWYLPPVMVTLTEAGTGCSDLEVK